MTVLSVVEQSELQKCEAVIERGLKTFIDVGTALMEIRDERLYREHHGTFEDYCRERWGLSRPRAYQLIDAAGVVGNLSTIVDKPANEAQVRPLASLPADLQPVVWERAVETAPNGKVTAAHVAETAKKMAEPAYLQVWELEGLVRSWLELQPGDKPGIYWLETTQNDRHVMFDLEEHVKPRRQGRSWRFGDLKQARNNVLDQLRQLRQKETAVVVPEPEEAPAAPDRLAVHYSSATPEWETPQWFYNILDEEFHFDLDVCATAENAKAPAFFTPEQDGLAQPWYGTCWMNPPYGKEVKRWVRKAYIEARINGATVVCLLPARTDTNWWWDYCIQGEIRFLKGRLKFGGAENGAPFPSAVVIFGRNVEKRVVWWEEGSRIDGADV